MKRLYAIVLNRLLNQVVINANSVYGAPTEGKKLPCKIDKIEGNRIIIGPYYKLYFGMLNPTFENWQYTVIFPKCSTEAWEYPYECISHTKSYYSVIANKSFTI